MDSLQFLIRFIGLCMIALPFLLENTNGQDYEIEHYENRPENERVFIGK